MAQEVEQVVQWSIGRRFESRLLLSTCRSVLGKDTESPNCSWCWCWLCLAWCLPQSVCDWEQGLVDLNKSLDTVNNEGIYSIYGRFLKFGFFQGNHILSWRESRVHDASEPLPVRNRVKLLLHLVYSPWHMNRFSFSLMQLHNIALYRRGWLRNESQIYFLGASIVAAILDFL